LSVFQLLLLAALGLLMAGLVAAIARGALGRVAGALWLAVSGAGVVFAVEPDWTTMIANAVGIRRGTDLLLYLLVLAVLQGFLVMYIRIQRLRRDITVVVRELAILQARRKEPDARTEAPGATVEREGRSGDDPA
jgi:hypothetical protein